MGGGLLANHQTLYVALHNDPRRGIGPVNHRNHWLYIFPMIRRMGNRRNGMGIATHDLQHIFEPFYRADKARSHGGTGLGLSIVKKIIDQHGSSINITRTFGKGAQSPFPSHFFTYNIGAPLLHIFFMFRM